MEFRNGLVVRSSPLPIQAAERVRAALDEAREGGYYQHAWYARMARWDVEALMEYVEELREA